MFLQENVCLTLLPKNSHGITQRPTLIYNFNSAADMSAHILLNLLNELGKEIKCNAFNNFNNTGALM